MAYSDPALQGAVASSIPASGHPSTALLHGQAPPAPELPAIPVQPSPGTETGTAGSQTRPGVSRVSNPRRQARLVGESSFPKGPSAPAPTQPPVTPSGAAAQPSRVPPAAPAPNVAAPTQPLEEPPPPAPIQHSKAPQAVIPAEVSAAAVPAGGSPGTNPTEEPVGPAKTPEDKTPVEPSSHKSITQAPAPPPKPCRESSKPPAARPWRHQPLISPVQNSNSSQDIVQAFISEIGGWGAGLLGLFPATALGEGGKRVVICGLGWCVWLSCISSLPAGWLCATLAGLTPPATPPHQLWKPLPTVSLLAKTKSPVSAPQEGSQRTAKLTKAKPLPQSKLQGRSSVPGSAAPSHVCSGDHDYCNPRVTRLENSSMAGTQPPATESGSRWNVKHHRDITIKPISSLTKRTLDQPKPTPAAAAGPSQESPGAACSTPLDYRTNVPSKAVTECDSPATSVLLSPAASPCRDQEVWTPSTQPGRVTAKKSLRCYRRPQDSPSPSAGSWRAGRSRASRSFSSSSDGLFSFPGSPSRRQSRSRSPSPCRRSNRRRRYSYDAQDHYQRQRILQKERAIEERRVVFIGKIPSRMTRSELRHRFSVFGDIEECTLHFRSEGDNYGFVTYRYAEEAFAAIESGHKLRRPDEQPFDLCFGGRRQFCRRNYADLDSNREDFDPAPVKSKFDSLDFDTLLRQAQRSLRR
uniref:Peroxisome proliferator-activated receptor gamma coactivator-related protein 1 n=1 Tax=Coturnix japonica TaxID=93934 RepID=A0A8C2UCW3_COTJA